MSNLSGFVKRLRDIMRNDAGINGDAQRIEQIVWLLFLKVYATKEADWEWADEDYQSIIPEPCRWDSWAARKDGREMTGDKLLDFVNNTLFPTLKTLPVDADTPIRKAIVQTMFAEANNYMKDGVLLRQVVNIIDDLKLGDRINLFQEFYGDIVLNEEDERYYAKGFRLSGRDNLDMDNLTNPLVTVDGDADYVVAYGIKGDQVSYTVQYQDENGRELAPSQVYYGNIGDKPIVAYLYIDGYIPQTLALTKTLSADPAENIFTFVYVEGDPDAIINHVTETVTDGGTTIVTIVRPGTTTGGAGGAGGAGGGAGGAGGGAGEGGDAGEGQQTEIEEDAVPEGTQDIVDLDEEETPLGDMEIEEDETAKGLPLAFSVGVGSVAAVVLICLVVWLLKGRKSGKENNGEE